MHGSWGRYLARRLVFFAGSLVALVTLSFLLMQLVPGDPARLAAGPTAPEQLVELRRAELGLDQPLWRQYLDFWGGLVTGDLGDSISLRVPVLDVLTSRAPATLALALPSVALVLLIAVPLGLVAGALTRGQRRPLLELGFTSGTALLAAVPEFLLGVLLVYLLAVNTGWFPVAGRNELASYVLPVTALVVGPAAGMARVVRAETINAAGEDYVRTARAKRMSARRLYLRHVLPNIMTSTLTISGLLIGAMVAGTVLVENIFAWPGLGTTIVSSIREKDFPLVQAIVITYGALVLVVNLLVDVALIWLDPRSTLQDG